MSQKPVAITKPTHRFEFSEEADAIAKQILSAHDSTLVDAELFPFCIVLAHNRIKPDWAGKCSLQTKLMRFLHGRTFVIQIDGDYWGKATFAERVRILCHELHHIGAKPLTEREIEQGVKPKPMVRAHSGSFCEIPDHDKYSLETAERIKKKLGWKDAIEL